MSESLNRLSGAVIGAAIEVHRVLGPGLLEAVYCECLAWQLVSQGYQVQREVPIPLTYHQLRIEAAYRLDLLVNDLLVVEVKAVKELSDIHDAQLITYLRMTGRPLGLLINFNVPVLIKGIRRRVLTPPTPSL